MAAEIEQEAIYKLTERRIGLLKQLRDFVMLQRDHISLLSNDPPALAQALRSVPNHMEPVLAELMDVDSQLRGLEQSLHNHHAARPGL
jgi:hypothetical protein